MTKKNNFFMSLYMAFIMTLTAIGLHGFILEKVAINFVIALILGFALNLIIPNNKIAKSICSLFKIKNPIIGLLISSLFLNLIVTTIMVFCMTLISVDFNFKIVFFAFLGDFPWMYIVSYLGIVLISLGGMYFKKKETGKGVDVNE